LNKRLYGLDLLRFLAYIAIGSYHTYWFFSSQIHSFPSGYPSWLCTFLRIYTRYFAFSGFIIVILSSFLLGSSPKTLLSRKRLFVGFLFAWLFFSVALALLERTELYPAWDIYPLFFVSLLPAYFLFREPLKPLAITLASLSACFLFLPYWQWGLFSKAPTYLQELLVGRCPDDYADWPVLPWTFLIWFCFWGGRVLAQKNLIWPFHKAECFIWPVGFYFFWIHRLAYFQVPLSEQWSCYLFRQEPVAFFGHFMFWAFWIRLSCLQSVQNYLASLAWVRWLAKLAINQHFFKVYLAQYAIILSLVGLYRGFHHSGYRPPYDLALLSALIAPELLVKNLLQLWHRLVTFFVMPRG
jgi:hypothetical protein